MQCWFIIINQHQQRSQRTKEHANLIQSHPARVSPAYLRQIQEEDLFSKMQLPLILSLVLLLQTSAFQTATHPPRSATCLQSELRNERQESDKKLILPPTTKRRLLSKLTTSPLSALTQLKKDERNKLNKERLLKMGITMMAFLTAFKKSPHARAAATPLIVTKEGAITPLIAPGCGIVEISGMRGIAPSQVGHLPNPGAWFFALAFFVTTTLLRKAGNGYARFVHFVAKHMVSMIKKDEEDIDIGLPKETDWDQYSHSMLDPLQKKKVEKISDYKFDPYTFLFLRVKKAGGEAFNIRSNTLFLLVLYIQ